MPKEQTIAENQKNINAYLQRKAQTKTEEKENFMSGLNDANASEDQEELFETLARIEQKAGDQKIFFDLFQKAGVVYDAAEIEKILDDQEKARMHETAKKFLNNQAEAIKRLNSKFTVNDKRLARILPYILDQEDTPEADANNRELVAELNSPEGEEAFQNQLIKTLLKQDVTELIPTTPEEMTKSFLQDPTAYYMLWTCMDLINDPGVYSRVEEPFLSALKEKVTSLQIAGAFENAVKLMASDGWAAFLQPGVGNDELLSLSVAGSMMMPTLDPAVRSDEKQHINIDLLSGPLMALSGALSDREPMEQLKGRDLIASGRDFVLDGSRININEAISQIKNDSSILDRIEGRTPSKEESDTLTKALEDLPTTPGAVKEFASYKRIIDYHKNAFQAAGIPLPTEAQLRKKMNDPVKRKLHEEMAAFYNTHQNDAFRMQNTYKQSGNASLERVYMYFLDPSDTLEAAEKNKKLVDSFATDEGKTKMLQYVVKTLMSLPDDFFLAGSIEEAARKYMADPTPYDLAYVACDIVNNKSDKGVSLTSAIEEPLRTAFIQKQKLLEFSAAAMKDAAYIMSRDDWAMLSVPELEDPVKNAIACSSYPKKLAIKGSADDVVTLVGARSNVIKGIILASQMPDEEKHNLCANGSQTFYNGKAVTQAAAFTQVAMQGIQGLEIRVTDEKNKADIEAQLNTIDTEYIAEAPAIDELRKDDTSEKAVAGNALHQDMLNIYNRLNGLKKNEDISSKKYRALLNEVQDLAKNPYGPEQVITHLQQIAKAAAAYLDDVRDQMEKGNLTAEEKELQNAVLKTRLECEERLHLLRNRYNRAEAFHNAFQREFSFDAPVKSAEQIYDEETSRMAEGSPERLARELTAKYRITAEQQSTIEDNQVTVVKPLSELEILQRLQNEEVMSLHNRAVEARRVHRLYRSGGDFCGRADRKMNRIAKLFMDVSGTPEAEEHNRIIAAAISTKEGCNALFAHMAYELVTNPVIDELMGASTLEQFLSIYEKNPQVCEFAFLSNEISDYASMFKEPLKTAYMDRLTAVQGGVIASFAVEYLASDAYLAFPEIKPGIEQQEDWNNLNATLKILDPDSSGVNGLADDLGIAKAMKELGEKNQLGREVRFKDESGKYISLLDAATAKKDGKKIYTEKLPFKQLKQLSHLLKSANVADPLDIGREVLEGRRSGIRGFASEENYHAQIRQMRDMVADFAQRNLNGTLPEMDEVAKLLKEADEAHPSDLKTLQMEYHSLAEKLQDFFEGIKATTKLQKNFKAAVGDMRNAAIQGENLARMTEEHQAYKKASAVKQDNGLQNFMENCLAETMEAPKELKTMAREGLQLLEACEGIPFERLSGKKKQIIAKGVAAAMIVNRMRIEKVKGTSRKEGSIADLLSKAPNPYEDICSYMAKSDMVRHDCALMLGKREFMEMVLTRPGKMDELLDRYIQKTSIFDLVNVAIEKAEAREEDAALAKFYSEPAHKVYVQQQKLLADMLMNPVDHSQLRVDMLKKTDTGYESFEEATKRTFIENLRQCIANIIAAKQINDFVKENYEALGDENIRKLTSAEGIINRAKQINDSHAMDIMMNPASALMRKHVLLSLAIGAEKMLDPGATVCEGPSELSESMLTKVLNSFSRIDKEVKPLLTKDFEVKKKTPAPAKEDPELMSWF